MRLGEPFSSATRLWSRSSSRKGKNASSTTKSVLGRFLIQLGRTPGGQSRPVGLLGLHSQTSSAAAHWLAEGSYYDLEPFDPDEAELVWLWNPNNPSGRLSPAGGLPSWIREPTRPPPA